MICKSSGVDPQSNSPAYFSAELTYGLGAEWVGTLPDIKASNHQRISFTAMVETGTGDGQGSLKCAGFATQEMPNTGSFEAAEDMTGAKRQGNSNFQSDAQAQFRVSGPNGCF